MYELLFLGSHTSFWYNVLAEKSTRSSFFGTHTLFFWIPYFFWHNVWPEKSMSSFFWGNAYFFWIPCFFRQFLVRKKYEFLFLVVFCHYVWPEESMSSFLLEVILSFWFLAQCLARKSISGALFSELLEFLGGCDFFDEQNVWLSYRSRVSRN